MYRETTNTLLAKQCYKFAQCTPQLLHLITQLAHKLRNLNETHDTKLDHS